MGTRTCSPRPNTTELSAAGLTSIKNRIGGIEERLGAVRQAVRELEDNQSGVTVEEWHTIADEYQSIMDATLTIVWALRSAERSEKLTGGSASSVDICSNLREAWRSMMEAAVLLSVRIGEFRHHYIVDGTNIDNQPAIDAYCSFETARNDLDEAINCLSTNSVD